MATDKAPTLYRVVKFQIFPTPLQTATLALVSENLRSVWNEALEVRQTLFVKYFEPLYQQLKIAPTDEAKTAVRKKIQALQQEYRITLFDQINALTPKRHTDTEFASVPRNWQEETLDTLDGSFKSFMSLRKKGDTDARPPRPRLENHFCEISGRYGFEISESGEFTLSCKKVGESVKFVFPVPDYQQYQVAKFAEIAKLAKLDGIVKAKKFTLYRDEHDLNKQGRFWVSVAYEISRPEPKVFSPHTIVYLALGASSIGVLSATFEDVIPLWRPDKHWVPKIEAVSNRMQNRMKGSIGWKKLNQARRRMQKLMARQQKQNHREIVAKLLTYGVHFVVTDYVVRSKEGKLADSRKEERGGPLGLNWSAQNTGSFGHLVLWLTEKATEHGGTVQRHELKFDSTLSQRGHENKIPMARLLRESFCKGCVV